MEIYDVVRVASRRLGVKVRLLGEAAVSNDADRAFVAAYYEKAVAARYNREASCVDVASRSSNVDVSKVLLQALFAAVSELGPDFLLPARADYEAVARESGLDVSNLERSDLRAFVMSCAKGGDEGSAIAKNILKRFFKPEVLSSMKPMEIENLALNAVCFGLDMWDSARVAKVVSGDEDMMNKLAMERMSPYSRHSHLHLGMRKGGFERMGYPEAHMVADLKAVRFLCRKTGLSFEQMVLKGLLKQMRDPIAIIKDPSNANKVTVVLDIVTDRGSYVSFKAPSVDSAIISMNEQLKGGKYHSLNYETVDFIPLMSLCKALSKKENIMDLRPRPGYAFGGEIIDSLRVVAAKRRTADSHRTLVPDALSAALKDVANVVNDFEPPKFNSKRFIEELKISHPSKMDTAVIMPEASPAVPVVTRVEPIREKPLTTAQVLLSKLSYDSMKDDDRLVRVCGKPSKKLVEKLLSQGIDKVGSLLGEYRNLTAKKPYSLKSVEEGCADRLQEKYGKKDARFISRFLEFKGVINVVSQARPRFQMKAYETVEEAHQRDFCDKLRYAPRGIAPGVCLMPRRLNGRYFEGHEVHQLVAAVAAAPSKDGCNLFLREDEVAVFGYKVSQSSDPVALSDGLYYNFRDLDIMDTELVREVTEIIKADSVAVPHPVVMQMLGYCGINKEESAAVMARFDNGWARMTEGYDLSSEGNVSLETALSKAEDELVRRSMHELPAGEISGMKVQFFYNGRNDAFVAMESEGGSSLIYRREPGASKGEFIVDGDFGGRLDQVKESLKVCWMSQHERLSNQRKQG